MQPVLLLGWLPTPGAYAARAKSSYAFSFAAFTSFDLSQESPWIVHYRCSSVETMSGPSKMQSVAMFCYAGHDQALKAALLVDQLGTAPRSKPTYCRFIQSYIYLFFICTHFAIHGAQFTVNPFSHCDRLCAMDLPVSSTHTNTML